MDYLEIVGVCKELYPNANTDWNIIKTEEFPTEEGLMIRVQTVLREPDGRRMTCFIPADYFKTNEENLP